MKKLCENKVELVVIQLAAKITAATKASTTTAAAAAT